VADTSHYAGVGYRRADQPNFCERSGCDRQHNPGTDDTTYASAARDGGEQRDGGGGQSDTQVSIMREQEGFTALLQRMPKMDMAGDDFAQQDKSLRTLHAFGAEAASEKDDDAGPETAAFAGAAVDDDDNGCSIDDGDSEYDYGRRYLLAADWDETRGQSTASVSHSS
jgi:hypothetical protein